MTRYNIIKFRRGTAEEWVDSLPQPGGEVLKLGEPGYEKDTGKLKIGDGVSGWNDLAYLQAGNSENVILTQEDVDDAVANLLVPGSGIVLSYDDDQNSLTISTSGLQPSGNYSVVGHSHVVNDITDFGVGVSGLLPNTYDAAVPWTANHTLADGTRYLAGDLVYSGGNLYKAKFDNESIPVSDTTYWENVGPGYRLNIDGRDIPNIVFPQIANPTDNRLLTSDGTSTGINAEQTLTFDQNNRLTIDCNSGNPGLRVFGDQVSSSITSNVCGNPRSAQTVEGDLLTTRDTSRLIFKASRGTQPLPSGLVVGDTMFIIRGDAHNPYGTLNEGGIVESRSIRIRGSVSNNGTSYLGSSLTFETTSGSALWDNVMVFDHNGLLSINTVPVSLSGHTHGYNDITNFTSGVESALSAGTRIYNLGAVSGNVSIDHNIDKQIQTLTLNGTSANLIEGAGWPSVTSVDVLLEITVSSTTSVTWTIVDDWYNPVPTLSPGKYLVLLRSMGTTIQGHYIGEKTS